MNKYIANKIYKKKYNLYKNNKKLIYNSPQNSHIQMKRSSQQKNVMKKDIIIYGLFNFNKLFEFLVYIRKKM